MCLAIGTTEVVSILVRKRNDGRMSEPLASQALANLYDEVIDNADLTTISAEDRIVIDSVGFIVQHSINSTDAIVLTTAVEINLELERGGDRLILVSSDQRLNRAAQQEGLPVLNPEIDDEDALNLAESETNG